MKVVTDLVGQFIIVSLTKAGIKDNYRNNKKQDYNQAPFHAPRKGESYRNCRCFNVGLINVKSQM